MPKISLSYIHANIKAIQREAAIPYKVEQRIKVRTKSLQNYISKLQPISSKPTTLECHSQCNLIQVLPPARPVKQSRVDPIFQQYNCLKLQNLKLKKLLRQLPQQNQKPKEVTQDCLACKSFQQKKQSYKSQLFAVKELNRELEQKLFYFVERRSLQQNKISDLQNQLKTYPTQINEMRVRLGEAIVLIKQYQYQISKLKQKIAHLEQQQKNNLLRCQLAQGIAQKLLAKYPNIKKQLEEGTKVMQPLRNQIHFQIKLRQGIECERCELHQQKEPMLILKSVSNIPNVGYNPMFIIQTVRLIFDSYQVAVCSTAAETLPPFTDFVLSWVIQHGFKLTDSNWRDLCYILCKELSPAGLQSSLQLMHFKKFFNKELGQEVLFAYIKCRDALSLQTMQYKFNLYAQLSLCQQLASHLAGQIGNSLSECQRLQLENKTYIKLEPLLAQVISLAKARLVQFYQQLRAKSKKIFNRGQIKGFNQMLYYIQSIPLLSRLDHLAQTTLVLRVQLAQQFFCPLKLFLILQKTGLLLKLADFGLFFKYDNYLKDQPQIMLEEGLLCPWVQSRILGKKVRALAKCSGPSGRQVQSIFWGISSCFFFSKKEHKGEIERLERLVRAVDTGQELKVLLQRTRLRLTQLARLAEFKFY